LQPVASPAVPIEPCDGELVVTAAGLDGYYGGALAATLRRHGRTDLLVAGLGLETTVHGTVRRGNDRGDECLTVIDACSPHDPALLHASRSSIEMSGGIFGAVGATVDVLAAYLTPPGKDPS
jgi:nicotinamidase-related amidase